MADPRGDVRARDLDIVSTSITRSGGDLRITFTLAAPVRNDSIYAAYIFGPGRMWQVAAKRSGGSDVFFAFDMFKGRQIPANGSIVGRIVAIAIPARRVGAGGRFAFSLVAERTTNPGLQDRAPRNGFPGSGKIAFKG